MVESKDDKAVTYVNSATAFGSHRIVEDVDRVMYISNTNMEERHQWHSIEFTIYL